MLKSWLKSPSGEKTIAFVTSKVIGFFLATNRWDTIDHGGYEYAKSGSPVIFVFWHGRLLGLPIMLRKTPISVLVSHSRDGRIISKIGRDFGIETIWGSGSKNSLSGYREMRRHLSAGKHIGITPDGPRGPARKAALGAIALARASGIPLVPMSWSSKKMKKFNSWDHIAMPKPFGRGVRIYGAPIHIAKDANDAEQATSCRALEDAINAVTAEADMMYGHSIDHAERRYGPSKGKR